VCISWKNKSVFDAYVTVSGVWNLSVYTEQLHTWQFCESWCYVVQNGSSN